MKPAATHQPMKPIHTSVMTPVRASTTAGQSSAALLMRPAAALVFVAGKAVSYRRAYEVTPFR
jgi:uncharacterized membrane protein